MNVYDEMLKELEKDERKGNRQLVYIAILGCVFLLGVPYLLARFLCL
jgi:hypothetical protein